MKASINWHRWRGTD